LTVKSSKSGNKKLVVFVVHDKKRIKLFPVAMKKPLPSPVVATPFSKTGLKVIEGFPPILIRVSLRMYLLS
jgi:hypothetical protein